MIESHVQELWRNKFSAAFELEFQMNNHTGICNGAGKKSFTTPRPTNVTSFPRNGCTYLADK